MAVGKNKRLSKGGKKGQKKKTIDPFSKKEWYDVMAPSFYTKRKIGETIVTKTWGTKIASHSLKGRVFETNYEDLVPNNSVNYIKIKLIAEHIDGRNVLTNFHGMCLTTDKQKSIIKKKQTMVEVFTNVKTSDGYLLRVFCIGLTKKGKNQNKTAYAKASQVKKLRAIMTKILIDNFSKSTLAGLSNLISPGGTDKTIELASSRIYAMEDIFIRKIKVIKKPKFSLASLMEAHSNKNGVEMATNEAGETMAGNFGTFDTTEDGRYEPKVQDAV